MVPVDPEHVRPSRDDEGRWQSTERNPATSLWIGIVVLIATVLAAPLGIVAAVVAGQPWEVFGWSAGGVLTFVSALLGIVASSRAIRYDRRHGRLASGAASAWGVLPTDSQNPRP